MTKKKKTPFKKRILKIEVKNTNLNRRCFENKNTPNAHRFSITEENSENEKPAALSLLSLHFSVSIIK